MPQATPHADATSDARLLRLLLDCPPRSGLARLATAEVGAARWTEPIATSLARWARGEFPDRAAGAFPISSREVSAWCLALLEECERLASARAASPFSAIEMEAEGATPAKAREQFRKLSLATHPDRHPEEERPRWLQRQVELNVAYDALKIEAGFEREHAAALEIDGLARHFGLDRLAEGELSGAASRARRWQEAAPTLTSGRPPAGPYSPETARRRRRLLQAAAFSALAIGVSYAAWRGGEAMDLGGRSRGGPRAAIAGETMPRASSTPGLAPRPTPVAIATTAANSGREGSPGRDPFDLSGSPALTLQAAPASTPAGIELWTPAPIADPPPVETPARPVHSVEVPTPRVESSPDASPAPARTPKAGAGPTPLSSPSPRPLAGGDAGSGVDLSGLEGAEIPRRVDEFLGAYARAYEREDLDRLGGLFLGDVLQNGEEGRETIMDRYERFFASAERVSMKARRASCHEVVPGGEVEARFIYKLEYRLPPNAKGAGGGARTQQGEATLHLRPMPDAPGGFAIHRIDFVSVGAASNGR